MAQESIDKERVGEKFSRLFYGNVEIGRLAHADGLGEPVHELHVVHHVTHGPDGGQNVENVGVEGGLANTPEIGQGHQDPDQEEGVSSCLANQPVDGDPQVLREKFHLQILCSCCNLLSCIRLHLGPFQENVSLFRLLNGDKRVTFAVIHILVSLAFGRLHLGQNEDGAEEWKEDNLPETVGDHAGTRCMLTTIQSEWLMVKREAGMIQGDDALLFSEEDFSNDLLAVVMGDKLSMLQLQSLIYPRHGG